MNMRDLILLVESSQQTSIDPEHASEAFWWVQRWISGSMTDPDWDETWITHVKDIDLAFKIVKEIVGNRLSVGKPVWRALWLSKRQAQKLAKTKTLAPHRFPYQSFTTDRRIAEKIGMEFADYEYGDTLVIVGAEIAPDNLMFGLKDLKKSKHPEAREYLPALSDWYYQDEVIVRVTSPIPLMSAEIVDLD